VRWLVYFAWREWPRASVTLVTSPSALCRYFVASPSGSVTVVVPVSEGVAAV
jgi:hypothetical protein